MAFQKKWIEGKTIKRVIIGTATHYGGAKGQTIEAIEFTDGSWLHIDASEDPEAALPIAIPSYIKPKS